MELTREQQQISRENHKRAAEYFNLLKGYVLHHTNTELRHTDIERYIQWNIEDLQVLTRALHNTVHYKGRHCNVGVKNGMYGVHRYGEENPMYGKPHSLESRLKISESMKGKHWKLVDGKRVYY